MIIQLNLLKTYTAQKLFDSPEMISGNICHPNFFNPNPVLAGQK